MGDVRDAVAGAMARSPLYAQMADGPLIGKPVETPADVSEQYNQGNYEPFESFVDGHINSLGLKANDKFQVIHPNGEPRLYRYLGPNSGGRKDWMELRGSGES